MSEFTNAKARLIGIYGTDREGRVYYPAQQCLDKMQHEYDQQADRATELENELSVHKRAFADLHHWYVHYCNARGLVAKGRNLWLEGAADETPDSRERTG